MLASMKFILCANYSRHTFDLSDFLSFPSPLNDPPMSAGDMAWIIVAREIFWIAYSYHEISITENWLVGLSGGSILENSFPFWFSNITYNIMKNKRIREGDYLFQTFLIACEIELYFWHNNITFSTHLWSGYTHSHSFIHSEKLLAHEKLLGWTI